MSFLEELNGLLGIRHTNNNEYEMRTCVRGIFNVNNNCFVSVIIQCMLSSSAFHHIMNKMKFLLPNEHYDHNAYPMITSLLKFYHHSFCKIDRMNVQQAYNPKPKPKPKIDMSTMSKAQRRNIRRRERKRLQKQQQQQQQPEEEKSSAATTIYHDNACMPEFLNDLIILFQKYDIGRHEDAQEFFTFLIDGLHNEFLQLFRQFNIHGNNNDDDDDDDDEWQEVTNKKACTVSQTHLDVSPISVIFSGRMRWFTDKRGMQSSLSYQPFYTIPLDILDHNIHTLTDALRLFIRTHEIDGVRKVNRAFQQCNFEPTSLPNVLVFHIKRFRVNQKDGKISKILKYIECPMDINMEEYIGKSVVETNTMYKFSSCVVHHGESLAHGHYTNVIRNGSNEYYSINDKIVRKLTPNECLNISKQSYLLFYERCL